LNDTSGWRERIVGLDKKLPLLDGRLVPYINLDNAASTPPLWDALEAVLRFLPYYSSVHRGSGFKSRISTAAYDEAHEIIGRFVGADMDSNTVIFRLLAQYGDRIALLTVSGASNVTGFVQLQPLLPQPRAGRGRPRL